MNSSYYKSDFHLYPTLRDASGKQIPFPDCDWEARCYTANRTQCYIIARKGDKYINCRPEADGRILFIFNSHRLTAGTLKAEWHFAIPSDIYPDGIQDLYSPDPFDYALTATAAQSPSPVEVQATLPYIKGDKGDKGDRGEKGEKGEQGAQGQKGDPLRYEDLTAEQIAHLQQPAVKAAQAATSVAQRLTAAEEQREESEQQRAEAESLRQTAEQQRQSAESIRATQFSGYAADIALAKKKVFIDLWCRMSQYVISSKPFGYDAEKDVFPINGLELTYEEAMDVYNAGAIGPAAFHQFYSVNSKIRTNFSAASIGVIDYYYSFSNCKNLEVAYVRVWSCGAACFNNCVNLHEIYGLWGFLRNSNQTFKGCAKLEYIDYFVINSKDVTNIDVSDSPLLNLATLQKLAQKTEARNINPNGVTVTLHPDVYAKLTGDTTNAAAAALSPEELAQWQAVTATAQSKNISFATI